MKNFTKSFLISLLMSGSFMVNAAEYTDEEMAAMANHCEISVSDLRELGKSMPLEEFYKPVAYLFDRDSSRLADELNRLMIANGQDKPFAYPQQGANDDYLFALRLDEEERRERDRRAEERANAERIRRLQEQEEQAEENLRSTLRFLEEEEQAAASAWMPAPVKDRIHAQTYEFSHEPAKRAVLEKFMGIYQGLKDIPQHSDVHILDNYVFGPTKAISTLLEVGRLYGAEEPVLSLLHVGEAMVSFIKENKEFFNDYKYEETALNSDQIIGYVNAHFANMDNEIGGYSPEAREVWSRAWTLALNLYQQDQDGTAIQIIFDQAVEGHVTRGGCIQGRIDRGFVGYVHLLCRAGVILH